MHVVIFTNFLKSTNELRGCLCSLDTAELIQYMSSKHKALGSILTPHKFTVVLHACDDRFCDVFKGPSELQLSGPHKPIITWKGEISAEGVPTSDWPCDHICGIFLIANCHTFPLWKGISGAVGLGCMGR